jgi:hypothetical protein
MHSNLDCRTSFKLPTSGRGTPTVSGPRCLACSGQDAGRQPFLALCGQSTQMICGPLPLSLQSTMDA